MMILSDFGGHFEKSALTEKFSGYSPDTSDILTPHEKLVKKNHMRISPSPGGTSLNYSLDYKLRFHQHIH